MPIPIPPQSHAQNQREEALRRLSRSPHPYHRQHSELPHASERIGGYAYAPTRQSPLVSRQNTDDDDEDDEHERTRLSPRRYHDPTPSDSGTEADDEHFLKGLPAPRIRPHKGLRGSDGIYSASPSPLPSPAFQDGYLSRQMGYAHANALTCKGETARKATDKFRRKRRVEIIRRISETAILGCVGGIICLNSEVKQLIWLWRRGELTNSALQELR